MISIKEFAKAVDRGPSTIYRWIKNGYLQRRFFANKLYFTDADIEKAERIKQQEGKKQTKGKKDED